VPHQYIYIYIYIYLGYLVEEHQIKIYLKRLFEWCKDRNNSNPRFTGRRLEAWSIPPPHPSCISHITPMAAHVPSIEIR
jgi:hypothetical protein